LARCFRFREEIIAELEGYLEDLRQETVAVKGRIAELKAGK
jgi:hypothetical protein